MAEKYWIVWGKPQNWEIALRDGIWGLIPKFKGIWRHLARGDRLIFYATSPVTGVIGFGQVEAKFKQNRPPWLDEIQKGEVLYPLRFEFKCDYALPKDAWKTKRIKISLPIGSYSWVNFISDQDIIDDFHNSVKQNWEIECELSKEPIRLHKEKGERPTEKAQELSHDEIKGMIPLQKANLLIESGSNSNC